MNVSVRRGELGVALVLLVLACWVVWESMKMPAGTLGAPGPGFFPGVLGAMLALTSLGLIVRAVRIQRTGADSGVQVQLGHRDIVITTVALIVVALLFEWLGYLLSATLFMLALLRAFSTRGWVRSLVFAVVTAVVSYEIFVQLLGVTLPPGLLSFG
jgi:putative tricarboxylic transport membrane protein